MVVEVAVIGAGVMGKYHMENYSKIKNANLVAVCDTNEEVGKRVAKAFSVPHYSDINTMMAGEYIEAVSVCTPTSTHKKTVLNVFEWEVDVLVEKPIALSYEDGVEMAKVAEEGEIKFMVGHSERFNPVIVELEKMSKWKSFEPEFIFSDRFVPHSGRITDQGALFGLCIHDIDIMRYLLKSEVGKVYAIGKSVITDCYDNVVVNVWFKNGAIASIHSSQMGRFSKRFMCLLSGYGRVELDFAKNITRVSTEKGTDEKYGRGGALYYELRHFVDSIGKNITPSVNGWEGLKNLEIVLAAKESIESGKLVEI